MPGFVEEKHHQCNLQVMHTASTVKSMRFLIAGKHHQRQLLRVKTILGTRTGAGCINRMQVAQGQDPVRKCALVQVAIGQSRCAADVKQISSYWRKTPQHLWRARWMQDCCKSRSMDDSCCWSDFTGMDSGWNYRSVCSCSYQWSIWGMWWTQKVSTQLKANGRQLQMLQHLRSNFQELH